MNKVIIGVIAVLVIIAGVWFWSEYNGTPEGGAPAANQNGGNESTPDMAGSTFPRTADVAVTASNFKFSMNEIRVKKGDTVRLTLTNQESMHDWKIDELGVTTKVLKAGEQETIEFTADEAGTFEYYCSVGTHRQMGMRGNLIIEE